MTILRFHSYLAEAFTNTYIKFMKSLISIVAFLMLSFTAFCQGGVNFESITFDEALAKAKAENKLVFMDCYTAWCGPCKYMAEQVFPQEKAGKFFNPKFICVKFDMEKGEGVKLARRYGINAYPTFLIIRPDGSMQDKTVGSDDLESFIRRIEKGLDEKNTLDYQNKMYEKGKLNKKQLITYQIALNNAGEREQSLKVGEELEKKLKDKDRMQKEYWPLLTRCTYGSKNFQLVLNNLTTFNKNIGKEEVDRYLHDCYFMAIDYALRDNAQEPGQALEKLHQELDKLDFEGKDQVINKLELIQARTEQNVDKIIALAKKNVESKNQDVWSILNALDVISNKVTKEETNRVLELEDAFVANTPEKGKEFVKFIFEKFKIITHVGVYFRDLSYEQALNLAQQEGRQLFIDCYTEGCGGCQYMSEKVLSKEEVGDFLNRNFICVEYEMREGNGLELAKKFRIGAYPTFVIVNPDGTIRHKLLGSGYVKEFIADIKESFDESKTLGFLAAKYDNGERDKAFLLKYAQALSDLYDPKAKEVVDELYKIATDEDKLSMDYWFIFRSVRLSPKDSEADKFLIAHRAEFNELVGKQRVDARLSRNLYDEILMVLGSYGEEPDAKRLDAIGREVKALKLSNEKMLLSSLAIAKAMKAGNMDKILTTCEQELPKLGEEAQMTAYYISVSMENLKEPQKTRWEKIFQPYKMK